MGKFIVILLFGWSGIHKFIEKKTILGIIYLFTFGLFGLGWFIDIIVAATKINPTENKKTEPAPYKTTVATPKKDNSSVKVSNIDMRMFNRYKNW